MTQPKRVLEENVPVPDGVLTVLTGLKKGVSSRKQKSLDLIHAICEEQHRKGNNDFRWVTIGRLSSARGGPSNQTIRNKEGKPYRTLIMAWVRYAADAIRKPGKPESDVEDNWLLKIKDLGVRAYVGSYFTELRMLKAENALLKQAANVTIDLRKATPSLQDHQVQVLPAPSNLDPVEIEALREAISENLFKRRKWTHDAAGRVMEQGEGGRRIFDAGFVTAIKKVLEAAGADKA